MGEYGDEGAGAVVLTANGVALGKQGRLTALLIAPTGAVTPTIDVYDNASAGSGSKLVSALKIQSAVPLFMDFGDEGVYAANGVYVTADAWTTLTVTAYVKG